jgi:hypothetical protein
LLFHVDRNFSTTSAFSVTPKQVVALDVNAAVWMLQLQMRLTYYSNVNIITDELSCELLNGVRLDDRGGIEHIKRWANVETLTDGAVD